MEKEATGMNEETKRRIQKLEEDLRGRILKECEEIKKTTNPKREINEYIRNIRWESPELAAFLKKEMLDNLNFDN